MHEYPSERLAVVVERIAVESRWETHRWGVAAVLPDPGGEPRTVLDTDALLQRLHPGFEVALYPEEAEGYFLNVSSDEPSVFVALRIDEASGDVYPCMVTVNYNEAARWMDGGERVERAPAWRELVGWMGRWVEENYRPEPRKRRRPRSFEGKEGQFRKEGTS